MAVKYKMLHAPPSVTHNQPPSSPPLEATLASKAKRYPQFPRHLSILRSFDSPIVLYGSEPLHSVAAIGRRMRSGDSERPVGEDLKRHSGELGVPEEYVLPIREQWDVLQGMVEDLQHMYPADVEWQPPPYTEAGRDTILNGAGALFAARIQDLAAHPPTPADPPSPSEEFVNYFPPRVVRAPSPDEYAYLDDSDEEEQGPTPVDILRWNLPVRDLMRWEFNEFHRVTTLCPMHLVLSGQPYRFADPYSGNVYGFNPLARLDYIERSGAMEWALYLSELLNTMSPRRPFPGGPLAPSPHGTRSRESVTGLPEIHHESALDALRSNTDRDGLVTDSECEGEGESDSESHGEGSE
ncbi:hypothetical protein PENSPDRAFT_723138 [Peniophora sp. CONT]|nr:hypothetical protein PENSPDRAFT_723138 [Peniophora sp. CONT]